MKLTYLAVAAIIAALAFSVTPTSMLHPAPKPAAVCPPATLVAPGAMPPFRGVVLLDVTASRPSARIAVSLEDFAPLFDRLRTSGGEAGVGLIRADSDYPLIRCYIPPPPDAPVLSAPPTGGNLFVNSNNRKREEAERQNYEAKRRSWQLDANARITSFIAAIKPLLDAAPTAKATDLTAAVERGDLMLAEPTPLLAADTVILLITDGFHNATAKATPTMHSNARVAVVNGVGSLGALAKLSPQPIRFESTTAAIRYLTEPGGTHDR
jgi:hypothetical protein